MMLAGLSILLALLVGIVAGARLQMRILRRQFHAEIEYFIKSQHWPRHPQLH